MKTLPTHVSVFVSDRSFDRDVGAVQTPHALEHIVLFRKADRCLVHFLVLFKKKKNWLQSVLFVCTYRKMKMVTHFMSIIMQVGKNLTTFVEFNFWDWIKRGSSLNIYCFIALSYICWYMMPIFSNGYVAVYSLWETWRIDGIVKQEISQTHWRHDQHWILTHRLACHAVQHSTIQWPWNEAHNTPKTKNIFQFIQIILDCDEHYISFFILQVHSHTWSNFFHCRGGWIAVRLFIMENFFLG